MHTIGFMFPGQGSQRVGMGRDLAELHPDLVDAYYRPAEEILGLPLSRLCWEGPAEDLQDTSVTQPAVFLTSLVTLEALDRRGLRPGLVAGHSLGEFAAMVSAGLLDWRDALRLVALRGRLMATVNERVPGAMAAVMGLDPHRVEELCAATAAESGRVVEVANDNGPDQVVVSGETGAVERLAEASRAAGARRVVHLKVGAPFHCSLMRTIEEDFARALGDVPFHEPTGVMISSVTAEPVRSADEAAGLLRRQLTGRVRWTETVTRMAREGADRFVEVGPGKVLDGLCRRILPEAPVFTTQDVARCDAASDALGASADVV
ncbi:ACP S-malonyltransferase [Thermomonospora umbrina]|uniref:Malonyl CoA-acyl carrier protein transacylase n=1 Tax=Thermomonospora umbrina TaxID=111806 RepID=A0A3D9SYB1_9ACTN|nr:ACP S-malonyltransferase [Thermomonospora umbrina]REF00937.1 [acyl-carrier-protein] S-malonyltransferase [Thermomonospora umbrina]